MSRPVTLGGQTYTPLGLTPRGWECGVVESPTEIYAVVCDGFTKHEGLRVGSVEAAVDDLHTLLHCLETTAQIAQYLTGRAGSN